jgi:predicted phosphodiesterase
MKVIAFGCSHFASPEAQDIVQHGFRYGYDNAKKLASIIKDQNPDTVINLGDWEEDDIEPSGMAMKLCPELANIPQIKIKGNHDFMGLLSYECDGILYEHGYNKTYFSGQKIIHAHTHVPKSGWPLDVGSLAFTGTYAFVDNGIPELRYL